MAEPALALRPEPLTTCRGCGCDDDHACVTELGPCAWVLLDIVTDTGVCSECALAVDFDRDALSVLGHDREYTRAVMLHRIAEAKRPHLVLR